MTELTHEATVIELEHALASVAEALEQLRANRDDAERAGWHAAGRLTFRLASAAAPIANRSAYPG